MVRASLPEHCGTRVCLALGMVSGLMLAALFLTPGTLHGEENTNTITGRVVNGTASGLAPEDLEVTLHIFDNTGEVKITPVSTDGGGRFQFQEVEVSDDFAYAVATSYQGILYSSSLDPVTLTEPVELTVYETTTSLEAIRVDADVLLISEANGDKGSLSAFEVISLVNEGDHTFVPDLTQPRRMNFLRFSLLTGATSPEVGSDLPGGEIIDVGSGFALTAPVTPGAHQVTYTYLLPYDGSRVELDRSFPMGAETFRLLVEDGLGNLQDSDFLTSMPPTDLEGKSYKVWGASQLSQGARLSGEIDNLPQTPLLQRLGDALTDGPYLRVGIPGAVGLVMASLLLYVLVFRQPPKAPATITGPGSTAAILHADGPVVPGGSRPQGDERRALVEDIARLDDLFQQGGVAWDDYQQRRQELKAQLLPLALTSQEGSTT